MRVALDRVMDAYRMMVNLTPEEEQAARRAVERHLSQKPGKETSLAVEGLRYLRARWSLARSCLERRHLLPWNSTSNPMDTADCVPIYDTPLFSARSIACFNRSIENGL